MLSRIPQGSILGPTALFADDAKIKSTVGDLQRTSDMQEDVNRLDDWSHKWQLKFNADKCKSMHLGHRNQRHPYSMQGAILEQLTEEKDLSIIIDKNVSHIVNKANQVLGVLRRTDKMK